MFSSLRPAIFILVTQAFSQSLLANDYVCKASNVFWSEANDSPLSPGIVTSKRLTMDAKPKPGYEPLPDRWKVFPMTVDNDALTYTIEIDFNGNDSPRHIIENYERTITKRNEAGFVAKFRRIEEDDEELATVVSAIMFGKAMGKGFFIKETQTTFYANFGNFSVRKRTLNALCNPR